LIGKKNDLSNGSRRSGKINNAASFQWHKPKEESFDGINPKTGYFDGRDPIFPISYNHSISA
jgi:hypothetical protein